jgi:membrane-bound inhibitor of C-type lysozyme
MISRLFFLSVPCALVLAGCISSAEQANRWIFTCPDGYEFAAVFATGGGTVVVQDAERKLKLKAERSASGARYTDGDTVFWNKGVMARLETGEADTRVVHQNCQGVSDQEQ